MSHETFAHLGTDSDVDTTKAEGHSLLRADSGNYSISFPNFLSVFLATYTRFIIFLFIQRSWSVKTLKIIVSVLVFVKIKGSDKLDYRLKLLLFRKILNFRKLFVHCSVGNGLFVWNNSKICYHKFSYVF